MRPESRCSHAARVHYSGEVFSGGSLQRESGKGRALVVAGVVGLLAILVLQLALSIRLESITWDEDDHLYSGYMSWKTGDFGLNPEHPPMVKMLAALPILGMQLKVPALQRRNFKHEAFLGGKDFLFKNDADTMLFRARMMASSLTVLLAILVFLAAQEMFSTGAAFLALTLLVFGWLMLVGLWIWCGFRGLSSRGGPVVFRPEPHCEACHYICLCSYSCSL